MRARARYLGLLPDRQPISDEDAAPLERVTFTHEAQRYLRRQLEVPGRLRGGLLFGTLRSGTLEVLFATPSGYAWWYAERAPLEPDERYVLGWSDCVETLHGGRVDWIGNWLAYADSQLGKVREDLVWLRQGARRGLFDDTHPLVIVGWRDGSIVSRAYGDDSGEPRQLPCSLGEVLRLKTDVDDVLDPRD